MPTFNYTPYDKDHPLGANALGSFALYYQRLMYKEVIYPPRLIPPLDTWYDKQYFGRVDKVQNTVSPNPKYLKAISESNAPNLFALNFVVDAFNDLVAHMRAARIYSVLRRRGNSAIIEMKATKAYTDASVLYNDYQNQVYNSFLKSLQREQQEKIINFETFSDAYMNYMLQLCSLVPVTRSNYYLTNIFNPFNSGLSIAIDGSGASSNDSYKYENYIRDPNFTFYVRSAKKFGFTVNKNMPWVLTADLFSNAMMKYLGPYTTPKDDPITESNFFDVLFMKTYLYDIDDLTGFIVNSYNTFTEERPFVEVRVPRPECDKTTVKTVYRPSLGVSPNEYDSSPILTDKKMIDFYLKLRTLEARMSLPVPPKLKQETYNLYQLQFFLPEYSKIQNAASYINRVYREYIYSVDYPFLNDTLFAPEKSLDNLYKPGNISTVGGVLRTLY